MESVVIPEGVEEIGRLCFCECEKLGNMNIPASVTKVGCYFMNETAWYDAQPNNRLLCLDGWLLNWKGNKSEVSKVEVLPGTKGIAELAMWGADNLSTLTIPSTIQYINENAFKGCDKLISVTRKHGSE
ncbi:MAG: leucine-rich repeat protein [Prevotella sp.]|nr:leucine-rich repeat protein [Prevotella sp.]